MPAKQISALMVSLLVVASGQSQVRQDSVEFDESFDPGTLIEPPLKWPVMLSPGEKLPESGENAQTSAAQEGYRIQVVSTSDYESADSLLSELAPVFPNEVYLTFDPPNYKVRVGNFRSRSGAEVAQNRLRDMGFRSAWIIRTEIE